jgi:hypothetical protein
MEKVLLDYFVAVAQYEGSELQDPLKQELHDVIQHVSVAKSRAQWTLKEY